MKRKILIWFGVTMLFTAILLAMVIGVGAQEVEVGTRDHPIVFLLYGNPATGNAIAEALSKMTGLYVEARVVYDYAPMMEEFLMAEGDVFGVLTPWEYVQIYHQSGGGIDVALTKVLYGYPYYFSDFYARRDSGISSIEDLRDKIWLYSQPTSISGYELPRECSLTLGFPLLRLSRLVATKPLWSLF